MPKKQELPEIDNNEAANYRMRHATKFLGSSAEAVKAAIYCKDGPRLTAYEMGKGKHLQFTLNDLKAYRDACRVHVDDVEEELPFVPKVLELDPNIKPLEV